MEEKQIGDELASIRSLMERSSKFISLSGLSGILAGVYALIGAGFAYYMLYIPNEQFIIRTPPPDSAPVKGLFYGFDFNGYVASLEPRLLLIALLVFIASVSTGILLTIRKAKRKGQPIWGTTSKLLLFNMATPLAVGGILILIFIYRGYYGIVASTSLIFYGLSLIGAGNFTFTDVKYLGMCEIVLGLIAACVPGYGLLFWTIGFGVLHIVYGSIMYLKYDK